MYKKKFFIAAIIGVVLILVAGEYWFWQKQNYKSSSIYTSNKYGFQLTLPDEMSPVNVKESNGFFEFFMNAENTNWGEKTFRVFTINTFTEKWWNDHARMESDGTIDDKNIPESKITIEDIYGQYLGKNNMYYFAYWRAQDCPGNGNSGPRTIQCETWDNVDKIISTFKPINK